MDLLHQSIKHQSITYLVQIPHPFNHGCLPFFLRSRSLSWIFRSREEIEQSGEDSQRLLALLAAAHGLSASLLAVNAVGDVHVELKSGNLRYLAQVSATPTELVIVKEYRFIFQHN